MRPVRPRLSLAIAQLALVTSCAHGPDGPAARGPRWLFAGFDRCPADVMPSGERPVRFLDGPCRAEPQMCWQRCESGSGEHCYALALYEQSRDNLSDISEALFLRACELGINSGCTNRAAGMDSAAEKNKAHDRSAIDTCAYRTFEKTCARWDAWGCTMLGMCLASGKGVEPHLKRALDALERACREEADPACEAARRLEAQIREQTDAAPSESAPERT